VLWRYTHNRGDTCVSRYHKHLGSEESTAVSARKEGVMGVEYLYVLREILDKLERIARALEKIANEMKR